MERQDLEGASAATSDDGAIDLRRLLSALDARKRWIVIPTIAATCLALAFVTLVRPRYIAITKVTLENQQTYYNRPDKSAPELATPLVYDAEGVQSEAETIATEELARKAVEKLGLVRNSEFNPESQNPLSMLLSLFSRRADADPEGRVADAVLSRLTVFAVAKSRVLQIEFSSSDPALAASGANTIAELYLDAKEEARKSATRFDATWLSQNIDKLRARVAEADAKVEAYRAESGLLTGANGLTVPSQQLAEINTQIAAARTTQTAAAAKAQLLRQMLRDGRLDGVPDVAKDESLRRYAEMRVTLKAQLAEQSRTLLPGHPRMQELNGQIAGLEAEMRAAAAKVVTGLEDEARLAGSQVRSLEAVVAEQSKTVATSNVDEVRLHALELDAKTMHEQLESYIEKYHEAMARDADNAEPPNARITSRALAPRTPVFPKKTPTLLMAALAGFFLSAGAVIAHTLLSDTPKATRARRPTRSAAPAVSVFHDEGGASHETPADGAVEAFVDTLAGLATPGAFVPIMVAGEGTHEALAVALTAARRLTKSGRTVLLDLGESQAWLADTFDRLLDDGDGRLGLSDWLQGRATFVQAKHRDISSALDIVPAGVGEINAAALASVLDALAESYAFVVIHVSDWRAPAAAASMASVAAVMLCAADGRLPAAQERLRRALPDPSIVIKGIATATRRSRERAA